MQVFRTVTVVGMLALIPLAFFTFGTWPDRGTRWRIVMAMASVLVGIGWAVIVANEEEAPPGKSEEPKKPSFCVSAPDECADAGGDPRGTPFP